MSAPAAPRVQRRDRVLRGRGACAKANGIFDGFPDNTFRQDNPINRGNFIRSFYGFAGAPDVTGLPDHGFTDVTLFYDDAVTWAKANGLADGYPDNTFRQNNNINRGNASRIFSNTAQTPTAWDDPVHRPTQHALPTQHRRLTRPPRPGTRTRRPPACRFGARTGGGRRSPHRPGGSATMTR